MAAFSLDTIFKATDKFSAPIKSMSAASDKFAAKQAAAFSKMRESMVNVRNQLIGLAGGLSVATLFKSGYDAIVRYDDAVQSLSAITGATGKQLDNFKLKGIELAKELKMSGPDILKAFELMGSAKPELLASAEALGEVSKQALLLSKAGSILPEDAVNSMAVAMNQFGAGADKAAMFADIFTTGQRKGSGSIKFLSEAIVNSGSTMKTFGNSFEDTVAILEGFAAAGIDASRSGTALSSIMGRLARSQNKDFNPQHTKAIDIINNLSKANITYQQAEKLVGTEQAKNLLALINQNKIVQELNGNLNEAGATQSDAAVQTQKFSERVKQLRSKFENLIISGNESSGVLNFFGWIIGFITKNLGLIIGAIGIFIAMKAAYVGTMIAWKAATLAYNFAIDMTLIRQGYLGRQLFATKLGLISSIVWTKAAAAAQWLWNAALLANPIGLIIIAIAGLIAGIILLIKHWDYVKEKIDSWSNSAIYQILSVIFPLLKIIELIAFFQDRWEGIKKSFSEGGFLEGMKAIGAAILSLIIKRLEVIMKTIARLTGFKWAANVASELGNFRAGLDEGLIQPTETTVNTQAAQTSAQRTYNESVTKNQMELLLTNKTDKNAEVKKSNVSMPIMGVTN